MKNIFDERVCFIICGGSAPQIDFKTLPKPDYCIAADGGYDVCLDYEIYPNVLIGDFDSISNDALQSATCEIIKLPRDKDDTDALAAVKLGLERGYKNFELFGALGSDFAHSYANLQVLNYLDEHGAKGVLIAGKTLVFLLSNNFSFLEIDFNIQKYFAASKKISLLSFTDEVKGICTKNLAWQLKNDNLSSTFPLGVSNEILSSDENCAKISIEAGKLLIICGESLFYNF